MELDVFLELKIEAYNQFCTNKLITPNKTFDAIWHNLVKMKISLMTDSFPGY